MPRVGHLTITGINYLNDVVLAFAQALFEAQICRQGCESSHVPMPIVATFGEGQARQYSGLGDAKGVCIKRR